MLADDNTFLLANDAAGRWVEELGGDLGQRLPVVVCAVAAPTRHVRDDVDTSRIAKARVMTRTRRLAVVRGSLLAARGDDSIGVVIEAARGPELAPLIADAYGLTARERAITELIAQGLSTKEISARLHLAAYTVQDHLKSIFDKTGTGSRGELVARLFFQHRAPVSTDKTMPASSTAINRRSRWCYGSAPSAGRSPDIWDGHRLTAGGGSSLCPHRNDD